MAQPSGTTMARGTSATTSSGDRLPRHRELARLRARPRGERLRRAVHPPPVGEPLWVRTFDTVEELRAALLEFRETYNATWLIERHGFRPPNAVRQDQLSTAARAA